MPKIKASIVNVDWQIFSNKGFNARLVDIIFRRKRPYMSIEEYVNNPLWPLLIETVHALVMYSHHKAYFRDVILHEHPNTTAQELATKLDIPLGEALVILYELQKEEGIAVG